MEVEDAVRMLEDTVLLEGPVSDAGKFQLGFSLEHSQMFNIKFQRIPLREPPPQRGVDPHLADLVDP